MVDSYPVPTFAELIEQAAQRAYSDVQKVRRDVMALARIHGITDQIPENWNEDGTLKVTPDEEPPTRERLPHEAG